MVTDAISRGKLILEEAMQDYPNTSLVTEGIYLLAHLHEELASEQLAQENEKQAIRLYQQAVSRFSTIISTWPDSPYAARAQYHKAMCLEKIGDHKQASDEYVRLCYAYPDSPLVADATVRLAVPALHFRARAHFENGDDLLGYKSLKAIAEDEDYLKHPLAAGALRRLADNDWANQEFDRAARYWKIARESYRKSNEDEARDAARKLRQHCLFKHDFVAMEALVFADLPAADIQARCDACRGTIGWATSGFEQSWPNWYYQRSFGESKAKFRMAEDRRAFYGWYASKKPLFAQAGRTWDHQMGQLAFALKNGMKDYDALVTSLIEGIRGMRNDPAKACEKGNELIGTLADARLKNEATRAFECVSGTLRGANLPADEKQKLAGRPITREHPHVKKEAPICSETRCAIPTILIWMICLMISENTIYRCFVIIACIATARPARAGHRWESRELTFARSSCGPN
jgi:hypothetical protein